MNEESGDKIDRITEAMNLLKEVAGTILTEIELSDLGYEICTCKQCKTIHRIQNFLTKYGIEWERCKEK